MTGWSTDELNRVGGASELQVASMRSDGSLRRPLPIWVVRVDDDLYVRSWRGPAGQWYRDAASRHQAHIWGGGVDRDVALVDSGAEVDDAVDEAYRSKYGRHSSYVQPMVSEPARSTTLRLLRA
jgi:hypothetical protein